MERLKPKGRGLAIQADSAELAGPEAIPLDEVVRQFLKANRAPRTVITDEQATYFGVPLKQRSLIPDKNQLLGATHFEAWLRR